MNNNTNKNEDIDLRIIFNAIKTPFILLWNFIIYTFQLIKKRWAILLFFIILGGASGKLLFDNSKPIFASTLVLSSTTLTNDFCADIIHNLDVLVKDNSPELLAKRLKINISSAENLKGFEFDNYNELIKTKYADKDTIVLGRPFKVKAFASSGTMFDTLQLALVNYLENNEYSIKRREIKKEAIIQLREKIRENIKQIDTLKYDIAKSLMTKPGQTNIILNGDKEAKSFNDPLNVFKEEIELYKEELALNSSLLLVDNIQVIQDFSPRAKPDTSLLKFILKYSAFSFILGILLIFILENTKNKKIENS